MSRAGHPRTMKNFQENLHYFVISNFNEGCFYELQQKSWNSVYGLFRWMICSTWWSVRPFIDDHLTTVRKQRRGCDVRSVPQPLFCISCSARFPHPQAKNPCRGWTFPRSSSSVQRASFLWIHPRKATAHPPLHTEMYDLFMFPNTSGPRGAKCHLNGWARLNLIGPYLDRALANNRFSGAPVYGRLLAADASTMTESTDSDSKRAATSLLSAWVGTPGLGGCHSDKKKGFARLFLRRSFSAIRFE